MADTPTGAIGARRRGARLLGLVGGVVVALLLCETILRAAGFSARVAIPTAPAWRWIVYDPVLVRKNQPGFVDEQLGLRINGLSFRGAEIARQKAPGTIRVACLGDSVTFGLWQEKPFDVRVDVSYPGELERLLHADGLGHVEVVNAGVLGYSTLEGLAQLLTQVLPLEPDVLTVRYGNNDHTLVRRKDIPPLWNDGEYRLLRLLPAPAFRLELVRLGFHAYRRGLANWAVLPEVRRVSPERFAINLRRLVELAHSHGVRVLLLDFPYRPIDRGDTRALTFPNYFTDARSLAELYAMHEEYQEVVRRVARDTGTPLLRTAEALWQSTPPAFSDHDLSHPNRTGAELLARLVHGQLAALGWLAPANRAKDR